MIDFVIVSFSATICPEPGVPLFGSYIGRLELGKTVTYSCYKAGLTLIGNKVRTCLHEVGKGNYWSGTLPSCNGNFFIHNCFVIGISQVYYEPDTAQKIKFSIKDFFSKCNQFRSFLRIWSHLFKKSLMENFIFLRSVNNSYFR